MTSKITYSYFSNSSNLKGCLSLIILFTLIEIDAQTVTSISPRIVTQGSIVTISGTDFTTSTDNSIDINNGDIGITNKKFVNNETLTFEINSSLKIDRTGNIWINNSVTGNSFDTGFSIKYIAPTPKTLRNSFSGGSTDEWNSGAKNNVTRISEIFTDWKRSDGDEFWRSSEWSESDISTWPNNRHNLLAFTYGESDDSDPNPVVTYSTGPYADTILTAEGVTYSSQNFKAYSTNGVIGKINRNHYLEYGDAIDGEVANSELDPPTEEDETITSSEILGATIYNSIVDGVNGLDLGTGITNFNDEVSVRFFSGNGQVGALDDVPDLLITQIADAGDGTRDVYYYADEDGNVVGRPISLNIRKDNNDAGRAMLAKWIIDLYRFQNGISFSDARPTVFATDQNDTKTIKMAAFKLQEFEISATNIDSINNINMAAGGNADIAFLAYNKDAFDIAAPDINRFPVSQFVCKLDGTTDIEFNAIARIDGKLMGDALTTEEELTYEWFKFNDATGFNGDITPFSVGAVLPVDNVVLGDLGTYNLEISNTFGKIILPVTLQEGGTPAFWNGTDNFDLPAVYTNAGITVAPENRSLIFSNSYDEIGENSTNILEGCDCRVPAGQSVTIPPGSILKLYDKITVDPTEDIVDVDTGVVIGTIPAGDITFGDGANLIQTKSVSVNENTGNVIVERIANNIQNGDYVYWSSPVSGFNISGISNTPTFEWDPTAGNPVTNSFGNYLSASNSIMEPGKGYIVKVVSGSGPSFGSELVGVPNNGNYDVTIKKSPSGSTALDATELHWNLIGNPYPSSIDADEFLSKFGDGVNAIIDGSVRIWMHTAPPSTAITNPFYDNFGANYSDQYLEYNYMGSNPSSFSGKIASGQGFFVQGLDGNNTEETLTFTNDLRFGSAENAYDNTDFYRTDGFIRRIRCGH